MSELLLLTSGIVLLLALCAFFSFAEIGMMAVNRYRLHHLAGEGHVGAKRVLELVRQPDKLLGVILIGNTLVGNLSASLATMLALNFFDAGSAPIVATVLLTIVMLIFGEVMPKTWAAVSPEQVSYPCARVLGPALKICMPLVVMVNGISNWLLKFCGLHKVQADATSLSPEELRTVVGEAGSLIPSRNRAMLLSIIDLNKATVRSIMVPRHEIDGIDLESDDESLRRQLTHSQHTRLPVYKGDVNNVVGLLHVRSAAAILGRPERLRAEIVNAASEPYFVPESTPLHTQLHYFQSQQRRIALVVDEYGEVIGLATLEDILEEIVGEFTTQSQSPTDGIQPFEDGYLIEGRVPLREINRLLGWSLPVDGPRTLNGLIVERLETFPAGPVSLMLGDYRIEVTDLEDNFIVRAYCAPRASIAGARSRPE
ncbi:HlyC/CorC family transporter [Halotalea alkalilenta]|uniref:Magnesium/cobalt efflux protein n=1 Tax=Halotalea alkalilenta TaxID=376489 RepID=A0A172YJ88_9GAMM|nr:HlyC/CorC family transporter [Halotalea alkalilenta]ANF59269.1 magnesium/cobalt efflux protein [Halotalea alkalilenta]